MRVGPAELLILLVVLAGLGAAAAFGGVVLARSLARHRPRLDPASVPLRPATGRSDHEADRAR